MSNHQLRLSMKQSTLAQFRPTYRTLYTNAGAQTSTAQNDCSVHPIYSKKNQISTTRDLKMHKLMQQKLVTTTDASTSSSRAICRRSWVRDATFLTLSRNCPVSGSTLRWTRNQHSSSSCSTQHFLLFSLTDNQVTLNVHYAQGKYELILYVSSANTTK
jgi:hypothetical protein